MREVLGLVGNPVRDLLDVAGDVGKLDAETADPIGELIDQPFAVRWRRGGRDSVRWLSCRHHGIPIIRSTL